MSGVAAKPIMERLLARVSDVDGCWLWNGSTGKDGYGMMGTGSRSDGTRKNELAHKVVLEGSLR